MSQFIPTGFFPDRMHRLATRLGVRDGEAYTIVFGLVVALVLAVVGLPGVFRGFDPTGLGQAAAAAPSSPSTSVVDATPPTTESVTTPSLPSLAPSPLPSLPTDPSSPAPSPTTTAPPLTGGGDDRPLGEQALLAEVPEPGGPDDLAVGPDGTVYVVSDDDLSTGGPSALWAFSSTGDLLDTWTAPGQPGTRTRGLTGVTVDPDGTVYVTDASTARLLRLDRAKGALVAVAEVDDIAACGLLNLASPCEPGLVDSAPLLTDVASAPDGTIVVADRGQGTLWTLAGGDLEVLTTITDRLPGDGPIALSFASDSELLVAVGARLTSLPPGLPAVLQIRLSNGTAEAPRVVIDLEVAETPGGIVAGDSGRVYVALPASGVVADVGIDQGDRIDIVGDGDPSFTGPLGLALRDRSLLVADASDRIFDLSVNDRPAR